MDHVDAAARKIQRNPEVPQEILPNLRHAKVKKFQPYALWQVVKDELVILGCIHGKRHIPQIIRQRRNVLEP